MDIDRLFDKLKESKKEEPLQKTSNSGKENSEENNEQDQTLEESITDQSSEKVIENTIEESVEEDDNTMDNTDVTVGENVTDQTGEDEDTESPDLIINTETEELINKEVMNSSESNEHSRSKDGSSTMPQSQEEVEQALSVMSTIKEEILTEVKKETQAEMKKEPREALTSSLTSLSVKSIEKLKSAPTPSPPPVASKQRLSLKEYQELQKAKEAEEIQIVSERRIATKPRQSSTAPAPDQIFKMETPSGSETRDLLSRPPEAPPEVPAIQKDPEFLYKDKITRAVKRHLNEYYGGEEKFDKAGNPKVIKIPNCDKYQEYCKLFSYRFRDEIKEAYESIHGNLEGIENISVGEYGIEHEIHKFFSELPVLNI